MKAPDMQLDDRGESGGGVDQHGIDTLAAADLALGLDGPGISAGFFVERSAQR